MKNWTTERLRIRRFEPQDADFVIELLNSEGWIRYIGDRNMKTKEDALAYIEKIQKANVGDVGACLVERVSDGQKLGMTGIFVRAGLDFPDVGFAFLPQFQGNGYAYESTKSVLERIFKFQKQPLQAITLPENGASIRLLERLGFQKIKEIRLAEDADLLLLMQID